MKKSLIFSIILFSSFFQFLELTQTNLDKIQDYTLENLEEKTCFYYFQYYDNNKISNDCTKDPDTYKRITSYDSFTSFLNAYSYHSNTIEYIASLLVDDSYHGFNNMLKNGAGMIILIIIAGLIFIGWIPIMCCWKKSYCMFHRCATKNDCILFWLIMSFIFFAAVLSFIIVCIIFGT